MHPSGRRNPNSMFFTRVKEKESIDIVNKCRYKSSTVMKTVKKISEGISEPLIYILRLFRTVVPN